MERVGQPMPASRKGKKKQGKDQLDREKQAEKKKRRLEKALANSAAIRSELEKKKQKKIEEQQRLDEEGAAIAEAVALQVLLGEDTDESCQFMLNNNRRYGPWDYCSSVGVFMGYQNLAKYSVEGQGWMPEAYVPECEWGDQRNAPSLHCGAYAREIPIPYAEHSYQGAKNCPVQIAAQAVSALQIAEDPLEGQFVRQGSGAIAINKLFTGSNGGNGVRLCP